jgi:hypothetical protein
MRHSFEKIIFRSDGGGDDLPNGARMGGNVSTEAGRPFPGKLAPTVVEIRPELLKKSISSKQPKFGG